MRLVAVQERLSPVATKSCSSPSFRDQRSAALRIERLEPHTHSAEDTRRQVVLLPDTSSPAGAVEEQPPVELHKPAALRTAALAELRAAVLPAFPAADTLQPEPVRRRLVQVLKAQRASARLPTVAEAVASLVQER